MKASKIICFWWCSFFHTRDIFHFLLCLMVSIPKPLYIIVISVNFDVFNTKTLINNCYFCFLLILMLSQPDHDFVSLSIKSSIRNHHGRNHGGQGTITILSAQKAWWQVISFVNIMTNHFGPGAPLLVPLGSLLVPLGSLSTTFGRFWAPFWAQLGAKGFP